MLKSWRVVINPCVLVLMFGVILGECTGKLYGQDTDKEILHGTSPHQNPPRMSVVPQEQWDKIDGSVERGLAWLALNQNADGSFPAKSSGNPGITSLCVMAFLSCGHQPGQGPYGEKLDRAVDYVLGCQTEKGQFTHDRIDPFSRTPHEANQTGVYNTSISGLMLGELYGMTEGKRAVVIQPKIELALRFMLQEQTRPLTNPNDRGGWRYFYRTDDADSDLSVTCWQVMFMRSAVNAGFEVSELEAELAMKFVNRCYRPQSGEFLYNLQNYKSPRAMAGAGVLCLFLTGQYDAEIERRTGAYLKSTSFRPYNVPQTGDDHYHYAAYYCSQAMFQLGGDYWEKFYPDFSNVLVEGQNRDGSWDAENDRHGIFGNSYTTALSILALTPPYQLLPLYQR